MREILVGHIRLYISRATGMSEVLKSKVEAALEGKLDTDTLGLSAVINLLGLSMASLLCESISNDPSYSVAPAV